VIGAVADRVAQQSLGIDHHAAADRVLEDAGLVFLAGQPLWASGADRFYFHGSSIPSAIPFSRHMG